MYIFVKDGIFDVVGIELDVCVCIFNNKLFFFILFIFRLLKSFNINL